MRITSRVIEDIVPHGNATGGAPGKNLDKALLPYTRESFLKSTEVFVNNEPIVRALGPEEGDIVYPGDDPSNGDLKFTFSLEKGDKISLRFFLPVTSKKG